MTGFKSLLRLQYIRPEQRALAKLMNIAYKKGVPLAAAKTSSDLWGCVVFHWLVAVNASAWPPLKHPAVGVPKLRKEPEESRPTERRHTTAESLGGLLRTCLLCRKEFIGEPGKQMQRFSKI